MSKISATEANQNFSKLLARVQEGKAVEITVRGEVVAEVIAGRPRVGVAPLRVPVV